MLQFSQDPRIQAAARGFEADAIVATAIAVQQIPAPTFSEGARGAYVAAQLRELALHDVGVDAVGNVYACRPGRAGRQPGVMVAAHLDTVFPDGTDLGIRREGTRVYGPGLGDNSLGVAALLHLARALQQHDIAHQGDIWFVANVGEEGLGDLRGMRAAVDRLGDRLSAAIALEGTGPDRIIHAGLGVRRYRVGASAAGGHSWADFGAPSAVHALVRLAAQLSRLTASQQPRSSFNIGTIAGGSSINTIAAQASLLLDLRSTAPGALQALVGQVERAVAEARAAEPGVEFMLETVGDRPAGGIPASHSLVRAAVAAYRAEGFAAALDIASTDANIPLSRGIAAVCVGVGDGENEHRLDEYIEPARIPAGMRALLRLVLLAAGAA